MWLLNTETLKLEEHVDPSTIDYAILSHTWEDDEVSFWDISNLRHAKKKAGFAKIANTCELARNRGIGLAWVDTCCINKSSSAELSEAINSMFQWYKLSKVCFVYLSDLTIVDASNLMWADPSAEGDAFARCRWFTRGWTLQELIAPKTVEFYDASWGLVGTKAQLVDILESTTQIPIQVLLDSSQLHSTLVAVKMSLAAQRHTKRIEDRAYSLLGIFDINMPLIYGEGPKAFRRLQEEIVKETNDLSLFAWSSQSPVVHTRKFRGIFADSPEEFGSCSKLNLSGWRGPRPEFSLTNKGIRIETFLYKYGNGTYAMPLGLVDDDHHTSRDVGIYLVRTSEGFLRIKPSTSIFSDVGANHDDDVRFFTVVVRKSLMTEDYFHLETLMHKSFKFCNGLSAPFRVEQVEAHPKHLWDDFYNTFINENQSGDFVTSLRITVRRDDKQSNEEFPLLVTMRVADKKDDGFAFIHGAGTPTPNRLVHKKVPEWLLDHTANPLIVHSFSSERIESLYMTMKFRRETAQEVYFWDLESLCPQTVEELSTAKFVKFGVQLETRTPPEGLISYEVILTGEESEIELGKAVKMISQAADL